MGASVSSRKALKPAGQREIDSSHQRPATIRTSIPQQPAVAPSALGRAEDAFRHVAEIQVLPHYHTLYCDRKREVCTADGAIREGNRLHVAAPTGSAGILHSVTWLRSEATYLAHTTLPHFDHADSHFEDKFNVRLKADPAAFSFPAIPGLALCPAADPAGYHAAMAERLVTGKPEEAPTPGQDSPLFTASAAWKFLHAEAVLAHRDMRQYSLTADDVGHIITAVVVTTGDAGLVSWTANFVGPVQASSPRIRELWIEGSAVAGQRLLAKCIYYGGVSGECDFTWMRVDPEGNRQEVHTGKVAMSEPLREYDPRVRQLAAEDVGCVFKVTCDPVRSDGARGAPSTSKPTAEVCASP